MFPFKIKFFFETSWWAREDNLNKQLIAFPHSRNFKKFLCTKTWFIFGNIGVYIDIYSNVHDNRMVWMISRQHFTFHESMITPREGSVYLEVPVGIYTTGAQ